MKLFWFDDSRQKIAPLLSELDEDKSVTLTYRMRLDLSVDIIKNSDPFDLYIVDLLSPPGGKIPQSLRKFLGPAGREETTEMGGILLAQFILAERNNSRVLVISNTPEHADSLRKDFPKRFRSYSKGDSMILKPGFILKQSREDWLDG